MNEWFCGTSALLHHRRRLFTTWPLVIGVCAGLFLGAAFRMGGGATAHDVSILVGIFGGFVLFGAPLAAGGPMTFLTAHTGACTRRADLLALPTGRLALPTAATAAGLGFVVVFLLALLCGLAAALGPATVQAAVFDADLPRRLVIGAAVFSFVNAAVCLGETTALAALALPIAPGLVALVLPGMGHGEGTQGRFLALQAAALIPYYLALPFALYARGRHHWATGRGAEHAGTDGAALLAALGAYAALGLFGWGAALGVGALGAAGAVRLHRRRLQTARPRTSALRVAGVIGVVALAPGTLLALRADAQSVAGVVERPVPQVAHVRFAPGGRWAAAQVVDTPGAGASELIARCVVVDLSGATAPVVLAPRFAQVAGWSADGRYLAVHDLGVGRMALGSAASPRRSADPWDRLATWVARGRTRTVIYDVHTGETSVLALREVADGWTEPSELVELAWGWDGTWRLRGPAGELAGLVGAAPPTVHGYVEQTPILRGPDGLQRLTATGIEPWARPAPTDPLGGWKLTRLPRPEGASSPVRSLEVRRGPAALRLDGVRWVDDRLTRDGGLLFSTSESLARLDLATGRVDALLHGEVSAPRPAQGTPGERFVAIQAGGAVHRLDRTSGELTPLARGCPPKPAFLADGRAHGGLPDGSYAIQRIDGSFVSLLAPHPD